MFKYKIYSDDAEMTVDITMELMVLGFTGYTTYQATGVWKGADGKMNAVPSWVVEAISMKAIPISTLNEVLGSIGHFYEQESVLFTVEPIDAHFLETGGKHD